MESLIQSLPQELISKIMLYTLKSPHKDLELGYLKYLLGEPIYNTMMQHGEIITKNGHLVKISLISVTFHRRLTIEFNIEALQSFPHLSYFNLSYTRVFGDVKVLQFMPNLSKFFLGNTKVTGDVHVLQSCPNLTHIYIKDNINVTGNDQDFMDYRKKNGLNYCLAVV